MVTFTMIGDRILLSSSKGLATENNMDRYFSERTKVLNEVLTPDEKFFELRDYSGIKGTPAKAARDRFRKGMEADKDRILGFIGFEAPLAVKLAINVGKKLYNAPFPMMIVKDYETAVRKAVSYLNTLPEKDGTITSHPVSRQKWSLNLDGFSCQGEIIRPNIIHAVHQGYLEEHHMAALEEMYDRIFLETGAGPQPYFFLAGLTELKGASRKARRLYYRWIQALHKRQPFRFYIAY